MRLLSAALVLMLLGCTSPVAAPTVPALAETSAIRVSGGAGPGNETEIREPERIEHVRRFLLHIVGESR